MLHLPGGVRVAWFGPETLHPSVGDAVDEDDEAFDKLGGGDVFPASDGDPVPRPAELRERTQKTGKGDESVTPKYSALD